MKFSEFKDPIYVTKPILPNLKSFSDALRPVWESHSLTNNGKSHQTFEREIKDYLKVPNVSVFNNGTIALITAIQSLRLSGDVITTPFTFPATTHVLSWNNINPIFCDIDPVTMTLDYSKIESLITPKTTGILAVHVYGIPCYVKEIQEVADTYGLRVVYDAAHAFGTEIDEQGIGNFGDVTMFSFHATKLLHTAEGGCLTYKDASLKSRVDYLKNFGIKNEEEVIMPGINGKLNEIQATLGLCVLDILEEERNLRASVRDIYFDKFRGIEGVTLMPHVPGVTKHSYQYFPIRIDETQFGRSRDEVHSILKSYNVHARKYFYPLCSDFPCYKQLASAEPGNLPVAQQVVSEVLCLPFYGELKDGIAEKIADIILSLRK